MRLFPAVLVVLAVTASAPAQTYNISTFAGGGEPVNVTGTAASLYGPQAVVVDKTGNLFFIDGNSVLRLDATSSLVTLVAGTGSPGFAGDGGAAASAQLNGPKGLALDASGNLYIADSQNNRVRMISGGVITTIAGTNSPGYSGDGAAATAAQLRNPLGLTVDSVGNVYIADTGNNVVRQISTTGVIATVAGNGTLGFSGDTGPATSAQLFYPTGVAVDSSGNIYIADSLNYDIRLVSAGVISTIAGYGVPGNVGDGGLAVSAEVYPQAIAVDGAGVLYFTDLGTNSVRTITNGVIATVAGTGTAGFSGDGGAANVAQLNKPQSLAVNATGAIYVADLGNYRIRLISAGTINTVVGNGTRGVGGDNGPATAAQLSQPASTTVDSSGNVYIADTQNNRIRKVTNGVITTFAGTGTAGFSGDGGAATSAQLNGPQGVAVDAAGNLYIADTGNNRIRKISAGTITTVAGNGAAGSGGDGSPALNSQLNSPRAVAVDSQGNIYIADAGNYGVREVSGGTINTIAGNGSFGSSGDGGSPINAQLSQPSGVVVDTIGNVYIADSAANNVREVLFQQGLITTVAGTGRPGFSGDGGNATAAAVNTPKAVTLDSAGNLYIADSGNNRIRRVSKGVITTIAGGGTSFGDNGPALSGQLSTPSGLKVDASGNIYVADTGNGRIRLLAPNVPCTYSVSPTSFQAPASGATLTATIQAPAGCPWTVTGLPAWITTVTASGNGSANVPLVVAQNNSGAALNATLTIAGTQVTVGQLAVTVPAGCTYAVSPGGAAFSPAGGTASITVTAPATCPWTATSTVSWVTISGTPSGTGNGTVNFTVAANNGGDQTGSIAIGNVAFVVEEAGAISGLTTGGSLPHIAVGGGWTTTITLVNTGTTAAQARILFFGDTGTALAVPVSFPQQSNAAGPEMGTGFDRTIGPGAEVVMQATGPITTAAVGGWAQLLTNGRIQAYAVFSYSTGTTIQDAQSPSETRSSASYVLPFDNTGGNSTSIAIANTSGQQVVVSLAIRDDTGASIMTDSITLPASGHTAFVMTSRYASSVTGKRGSIVFTSPSAGQISVLGIRNNATGTFSNIPALIP